MKDSILCYKTVSIYFLFLLMIPSINAQESPQIDSLKTVWFTYSNPDSLRLEAVKTLTNEYYLYSNIDSTRYYLKKQQDLAQRSGLLNYFAWALNTLGGSYYLQENYDSALVYFNKGLEVFEKLNDQRGVLKSKMNVGVLYENTGRYSETLSIYDEVIKKAEEIQDEYMLCLTYSNKGNVLNYLGNYQKGIELYLLALELDLKRGNKRGMAYTYANLAIGYANLDMPERSIEMYEKAILYAKEANLDLIRVRLLHNLGHEWSQLGDYDKALSYFNESIALGIRNDQETEVLRAKTKIVDVLQRQGKLKEAYSLAITALEKAENQSLIILKSNLYNGLIRTLLKMNNIEEAERYGQKLKASYEEQKRSFDSMIDLYSILYQIEYAKGNYKKAFDYFKKKVNYQDSSNIEQNKVSLVKQETQYQYEKKALADSVRFEKEKEIKEAEIAKQRSDIQKQQIGLASTGMVLLLIAGLAFSIYRGKQKSEELLLNILPYETAQELKKNGSSDAKLIDHTTVLFTDFKGFTELSAQLSPQALVKAINECFSEFDAIMDKWKIEKIKTIGDAYMAAGGLPTINDTHPQDVVNAALEIQQFMHHYKERKEAEGLPFFEIRIGVHTGSVVAGIVGIKKFQYDIWGDTVNTAARMESHGAIGKVNISEATYNLIKDEYKCTPRGSLEVKGKGEMTMYFVEGKKG